MFIHLLVILKLVDLRFYLLKEIGLKQYGYKSNGVLAVNDGGAGNIPIATSGYYKLTVNTGDATYSIEPYSDPTNTYSVISIIGNCKWKLGC